MWFMNEVIAGKEWYSLPVIILVLQLGSALISFVTAASAVVRRVRGGGSMFILPSGRRAECGLILLIVSANRARS